MGMIKLRYKLVMAAHVSALRP